ncbi:MAG TPA: heme lyase CcmF/NrfE family subunit [Actinomycetota bacterium]|nr:heme lyase CcmF/NrfE family subunit [Actinomycetota bacterium]
MMSLASLGKPSLVAALGFALSGLVLCALGATTHRAERTHAGVRALTAAAVFTGIGALSLMNALLVHDFSLEYAANYTSRSLSVPYTFAALWGGMEGSLLFWTLLLTSFSAVALRRARARTARLVGWAGATLAVIQVFFLALLAGPADPFTRLATVPADGTGLNPLLQSPGMLIHPPLLYTGFVGFSIPFAFAMAALMTGRLDPSWFTATRRWTLFAWSALSIGIVLGGAWAYTELGWGGYWAWDPVENASFMPWLTATAFLHSVVIQEKRQMFKVWNVVLILLTYVLAVFGTFLTRSGILSSIHTFTEGDTGKWFLPFLAVMLLGGLGVVAARLDKLRSENRFDSLLSRESAFLLNNVLFVAAAFTVLWGTIYPIINEVATGVRVSVGPPFFNSVFVPIGLALILLTGIGPLISWRRMSKGSFGNIIRIPLAAGALVAVALGVAGVRSSGALLAFALCAFTFTAIAAEFARGSSVHRSRGAPWASALIQTLVRNRRRYGGYIVHLGVVLIVIGFAGAAFRSERHALLQQGDALEVGGYTLRLQGFESEQTAEKNILQANLVAERGGDPLAVLRPQRNFHRAQRQAQSEVAIRTTPVDDLYVVITSIDADGTAAVRAFVNPLTWWIWAGAVVMAAGMTVLLTGASARAGVGATVPAPLPEPAVAAR